MLNGYKRSGATLFIRKAMLNMKKMKAELNEHRYYLERNVEQRTEHLLKHIAVLESCNAALCGKLALVQRDPATLQPAQPKKDTETNDRSLKLYVMNNQSQKLIGSNVQDKWGEQITAA
jgi:hypothetical protein